MTDATTEFFESLGTRGHEPRLEKATGTIRFDLSNDKRVAPWLVRIEKGDITVSRKRARADCVAQGDRGLFEAIVKGEVNPMAALLRGAMYVEGDPELLVLFQRLFPGPPGATGRPPAGRSRKGKR
jgi:predicted lipid carrier protein YhbT